MILRLILVFMFLIKTLSAVSITLDGSIERLSGTECGTATYRFGTDSSYQGQNLDLILEVTAEDNDYTGGACVDTQDDVVSFHLRDRDFKDNLAYMDLKFTVVKKGTLTPINVDLLTTTNFDLDSNPGKTLTDDVYYKNPLKTLISNDSDVALQEGDFYGYNIKLRGKTDGNCNDSSTLTELSCRAGAIWQNTSSIYARIQNDNAYGQSIYTYDHRLLQFSFEYDDIAPLVENNSTGSCGIQNYSTTSTGWIEGDTPSNYTNRMNIQKSITVEGASQLEITINGATEEMYDFLYIIDEKGNQYEYTGEIYDEQLILNGSNVTLKFISDYTVIDEGVTVTIKGLGCSESSNSALCYALPDNSSTLYKVAMDPLGIVLPQPTRINLSDTFNAEGTAYRASQNMLYTFKELDGNVVKMYGIDLNTYNQSSLKNDLFHGTVEGAEFYYDPALQKEILYIISKEENSQLYAFDPDGWNLIEGYPKNTNSDLSSLAIDPLTGVGYAIDDYNYDHYAPTLYRIDLKSGLTTKLSTLSGVVDAEGLAFASDGKLYLEDEGHYEFDNERKVYQLDPSTGALTPAAILGGSDDVEGLSCNGTQMAMELPTISLIANPSTLEGESGRITEMLFDVTLNHPAPQEITFNYKLENITAIQGEDYQEGSILSSQTITIPKDANGTTISVLINGDNTIEEDETFSLSLENIQNALFNSESIQAIGTIINDDHTVKVSIFDTNITEGDEGTQALNVNLTLDQPAPVGGVTVQIEPKNITAMEGEDFSRESSSVYFAPTQTTQSVTFLINGDTDLEDNETFSVEILPASNIEIDPLHALATVTIINDDEEQADLVAEYRFDECPLELTGEIEDHTPYRHRHRVRNGFTTHGEIAQINRSGAFHRAQQQYTEGEDGLDEIFGKESQEFTITTWVYPTSLSSDVTNHNTANTFFAKASDSKNDNIEIGINPNGTLHLYLDTLSKDRSADFGEAGEISTQAWHFIGVSYKAGIVTVQIDDKTYTNTTTWSGATSIDQAIGSPVTIGASLHINNYFDGYIDEFKIFRNQIQATTMNRFRERERNRKNWDDTPRETLSCPEATPTGCIKSAFMFQNQPTDINILNLVNGEMVEIKADVAGDNINALGFNKKDGFFWGYNHTLQNGTLTRIGMDPNQEEWVAENFSVEGLSDFDSYVGDINSKGELYLKGTGESPRVVVIDLDPKSPTYLTKIKELTLDFNLNTADWAFNPKNDHLYAVNNGGATKWLYEIDPLTGKTLSAEDTELTGYRGFGAGFFDANGFYYVYDNGTAEIFRIDVMHSPKAIFFSRGIKVSLNDGAMCTDVEFKFDFGDLPENYPTKLDADGARHAYPAYGDATVYLGAGMDNENDGTPSSEANLDQYDDGVTLDGSISLQNSILKAGTIQPLEITTHDRGYLNAWIDWNGDGDFNDPNEQIAKNLDGASGKINLTISIPSKGEDLQTYARFRYSSDADLEPTGSAIDGEVEDYAFTIEGNQEPFSCSNSLYLSNRSASGSSNQDEGATWLHEILQPSLAYSPIGNGYFSSTDGYNAIGYNIQDNYIYALEGNHLLKIGKNGNVTDQGEISGLPATQLYAGEFDREGNYYVTANGNADNTLYKIDIQQKNVTQTITLSESVRFWDMAIDPTGDYFYVVLIDSDGGSYKNDHFAKIEIATGAITKIGDTHADLPSYISLIFSDKEGKTVALAQDGGFYEVSLETGKLYLLSPSEPLTFYNDGTSCADANITLPPHPPRLSINDVQQAEGDSGETIFHFTVTADRPFDMIPISGAVFYYKVIDGDGNEVTPPHGVALSSDNDFKTQYGMGMGLNLFGDDLKIDLPVTVYGDEKLEKDEEFYVEIYSPQIPTGMSPAFFIDKNVGIGLILNDDMDIRVERPSTQSGDLSSLYTQIAGRDFDYSVASYTGEEPYPLEDMTFKVELVDNNSTNRDILYEGYVYFENDARVDQLDPDDLKIAQASRDLLFRLSYLKDENGSLLKGRYDSADAYNEQKESANNSETIIYESSDHFALRPAYYHITLGDQDEENSSITYQENNQPQNSALKLVAQYPYTLKIEAQMESNNTATPNYTTQIDEINASLLFEGDASKCWDSNDTTLQGYQLKQGSLSTYMSHDNVGDYRLHIEDSHWSAIDQANDNLGCILESHSNTPDASGRIGCNLASDEGEELHDIEITFEPYGFSFQGGYLANINNNGKSYLYMSDLEQSKAMGVKLVSTLVATGKEGDRMSNFTSGCLAKAIDLTLEFDIQSDQGSFGSDEPFTLRSIEGKPLMAQNLVDFNDENNTNLTPFNQIHIDAEKFLPAQKGELNLTILYNIEKYFDDPANPIAVTFKQLDANSSDEGLKAQLQGEDHYPSGTFSINSQKRFYFARVASYTDIYPETQKLEQETPLFIEIFCHDENRSWCDETMEMKNIGRNISQKTDFGWYRAVEHNSATDGKVVALISDNPDMGVRYPTPLPPFDEGRLDGIYTYYKGSGITENVVAQIAIDSDVWLRYNTHNIPGMPLGTSSYTVEIKSISSTTGAGNTGNLMQSVQHVEHNGKMSW